MLAGKDTANQLQQLELKSVFETKPLAITYIKSLPALLFSKGFPTASVDSLISDTSSARAILYLGEPYKWVEINTDKIDEEVLNSVGWNGKQFNNKIVDFSRLQLEEKRIVSYYENAGYPFAEAALENVEISGNKIKGDLRVKKGPLYHIDSIRIIGDAKVKNKFLQHYLDIPAGSIYNNKKLQQVTRLIQELPFLQEHQPWNITMLGTGGTLNLYLEPKRSSEINVLVGFLPGNAITGKTKLTADVHLNLNNPLGSGENVLLNWQQLQPQSPRLNLGYTHPYIFNSDYGINFSFDLLKKDSSYLQLSTILALQYNISSRKAFKIYYQNENSYLLSGGVDTSRVIYSKKLPPDIDVSSGNVGIEYHAENTNYRLNPKKGNEIRVSASAGIKKTGKNNDIVTLTDPNDPTFDFNSLYDSIKPKTYRFRVLALAAHYFPFRKNSTLRTAVNVGWLQSPQTFRNELFRVGGYKILRGFDEESIYASQYAVFTLEYRYLVGINSYFFGFSDAGFTNTNYSGGRFSNSFLSGGAGLVFETKFGLLNLSYAVGKRNDLKFDIRNSSKIHFGYINYF